MHYIVLYYIRQKGVKRQNKFHTDREKDKTDNKTATLIKDIHVRITLKILPM